MKASVFKKVENFNEKAKLLKSLGYRSEETCIDDANKCDPHFIDTGEEIPSWSGEMYAEYFYDENNELVNIIALW